MGKIIRNDEMYGTGETATAESDGLMSAEDKSKLSRLNTNTANTAHYTTVDDFKAEVEEAQGSVGDAVVGYCEGAVSSYLTNGALDTSGKLIMLWRGKNKIDYLIWGGSYLYTGRYEAGVLSQITKH